MKNEEMNYMVEFIDYMWQRNFRCYFEKGTGNSKINREEKVVVLDILDPELLMKIWIAKQIADQIFIKEQIQAAKQ